MKVAQTANEQCLGYSKKDHRRCRLQRRPGEKTCLIHKHYYTNWFNTHTVNEWRTAGKRCRSEIVFQLRNRHVVPPSHILARIPTHSLDVWNLFVQFSDEPISLNEECFHFAVKNIVKSLLILKHTGSDKYRDYIQTIRKSIDIYLKTPDDCKMVFLKILNCIMTMLALQFETFRVSIQTLRLVLRILFLKPNGWRQMVFSRELETLYSLERSTHVIMWPDTYERVFVTKLDPAFSQVFEEMQNKHKQAIQTRVNILKEDLIAAALHPCRIEPLIEKYGIEVLDDF
jgi:hypothetical protein